MSTSLHQVLPREERIAILTKRMKSLEAGCGDHNPQERQYAINTCKWAIEELISDSTDSSPK